MSGFFYLFIFLDFPFDCFSPTSEIIQEFIQAQHLQIILKTHKT